MIRRHNIGQFTEVEGFFLGRKLQQDCELNYSFRPSPHQRLALYPSDSRVLDLQFQDRASPGSAESEHPWRATDGDGTCIAMMMVASPVAGQTNPRNVDLHIPEVCVSYAIHQDLPRADLFGNMLTIRRDA